MWRWLKRNWYKLTYQGYRLILGFKEYDSYVPKGVTFEEVRNEYGTVTGFYIVKDSEIVGLVRHEYVGTITKKLHIKGSDRTVEVRDKEAEKHCLYATAYFNNSSPKNISRTFSTMQDAVEFILYATPRGN